MGVVSIVLGVAIVYVGACLLMGGVVVLGVAIILDIRAWLLVTGGVMIKGVNRGGVCNLGDGGQLGVRGVIGNIVGLRVTTDQKVWLRGLRQVYVVRVSLGGTLRREVGSALLAVSASRENLRVEL